MKRTLTDVDCLPLELDDGTRITCTSIAGGARSTRGVPDFLNLCITDKTGSSNYRYTSECASDHNPWPKFEPHPDDNERCYRCGTTRSSHGLDVLHCPPAVVAELDDEKADDLDGRMTFGRCYRLLDKITTLVKGPAKGNTMHSFHDLPELVADLKRRADAHSPLDLPGRASKWLEMHAQALLDNQSVGDFDRHQVQALGAYVIAERLSRASSASMLSSLLSFAGMGFGETPRAVVEALRKQPQAETKPETTRPKPQPSSRRRARPPRRR